MAMFTRRLQLPPRSFFLLGPRGTGKTTWLERGFLLETWMLHELRATIAYEGLGGELRHWRTPSESEVDFIWTRAKRAVGIEVKAARNGAGNSAGHSSR